MHGLVDPERRLAPYDLALTDLDARDRRAWGERVVRALARRFGDLNSKMFEVHAGAAYYAAIEPEVFARVGGSKRPFEACHSERNLGGMPLDRGRRHGPSLGGAHLPRPSFRLRYARSTARHFGSQRTIGRVASPTSMRRAFTRGG